MKSKVLTIFALSALVTQLASAEPAEVLLMCVSETDQFEATKEDGSPFFVHGKFEQDKTQIRQPLKEYESAVALFKRAEVSYAEFRKSQGLPESIQEQRPKVILVAKVLTGIAGMVFGLTIDGLEYGAILFAIPGPLLIHIIDSMIPKFGRTPPVVPSQPRYPDLSGPEHSFFAVSLYEDVVRNACGGSRAHILKAKQPRSGKLYPVTFRQRPVHHEL